MLMTMFRNVYDHWFFPTEQEVTDGSTQYDGAAQPDIVSHED